MIFHQTKCVLFKTITAIKTELWQQYYWYHNFVTISGLYAVRFT